VGKCARTHEGLPFWGLEIRQLVDESGKRLELFGKSRAEEMAKEAGAPLLGQIPIDPELARLCDEGDIERYDSEFLSGMLEVLLQAVESAVASAAKKIWTVDKEEEIRVVLDRKTGKLTAYAGDKLELRRPEGYLLPDKHGSKVLLIDSIFPAHYAETMPGTMVFPPPDCYVAADTFSAASPSTFAYHAIRLSSQPPGSIWYEQRFEQRSSIR